jgi:lipoate-protein ligase A
MFHCDLVLPSLAANLALDEALLLAAEDGAAEVLRLWAWASPAVILGAGGRWAEEADAEACARDQVPILRRSSGGGAVLLGSGCLCYTLVLRYDRHPALSDLYASYRHILGSLADALRPFASGIEPAGISDLAAAGRKIGGSAQQRKRHCLLHHGTLLHAFDVGMLSRYLRHPPREPDYRTGRSHSDFVTNLSASADDIGVRLRRAWGATESLTAIPEMTLRELLAEKYDRDDWHRRR